MNIAPLTLLDINRRIADAIVSTPGLANVWLVAETSDLRCTGGHCYMELIDKDETTGSPRARARATIWASRFARLNAEFRAATGSPLTSNIKIMVQATATFHPVYGLSLNITDVNPEYTLGDLLRRRREMIARLQAEGILNCNRELQWPPVPWRIAVISAAGAAGYGDFIDQLYNNIYRLRFSTRLFEARMQGEDTAPSIIAALERIAAADESYDCVVIIRGGGATGDLAAFDNYELAANIALFPLPVIVGIGHERDITLLDYVANMRVKTPTAAAAWLVGRGADALARLAQTAAAIHRSVADRIGGCRQQLEYIRGALPTAATAALSRARNRLVNVRAGLAAIPDSRLRPQAARLDAMAGTLTQAVATAIDLQRRRLDADAQLIAVLSPEATLRRGYSITRVDGRAVTSAADIAPGTEIETILASGTIRSTAKD